MMLWFGVCFVILPSGDAGGAVRIVGAGAVKYPFLITLSVVIRRLNKQHRSHNDN